MVVVAEWAGPENNCAHQENWVDLQVRFQESPRVDEPQVKRHLRQSSRVLTPPGQSPD